MIGHPLLAVPDQVADGLVSEVGSVHVDAVDLGPAFAAGLLEGHVDVGKGLVGFVGEGLAHLACFWVPSAFLFLKEK